MTALIAGEISLQHSCLVASPPPLVSLRNPPVYLSKPNSTASSDVKPSLIFLLSSLNCHLIGHFAAYWPPGIVQKLYSCIDVDGRPKLFSRPERMVMERVWSWCWKSGPSGFGSWSTAEQVTEGIDASNLTAIVTGATSGIGRETARVLALRGATVILPVRDVEKGLKAKETLVEEVPTAKVEVMEMDLSSMRSVRAFAHKFLSSLNILVNNAAVMACPFRLSEDGIELQFATNHIGHFLLTNLLLDKMKATANESGIGGRIVIVASLAHTRTYWDGIRFHKINSISGYSRLKAYGQSKLANILHAKELAKFLQEEGANVTVNSLHPGLIPTNIFRHLPRMVGATISRAGISFRKDIQQGAATTCYLALHPNLEGVSGKYFSDCNEVQPSKQATDANRAKTLWELSNQMIGTKPNPN